MTFQCSFVDESKYYIKRLNDCTKPPYKHTNLYNVFRLTKNNHVRIQCELINPIIRPRGVVPREYSPEDSGEILGFQTYTLIITRGCTTSVYVLSAPHESKNVVVWGDAYTYSVNHVSIHTIPRKEDVRY